MGNVEWGEGRREKVAEGLDCALTKAQYDRNNLKIWKCVDLKIKVKIFLLINFYFFISKAVYHVVVYHSCGLHMGVDNGWAYKFEASFFKVFT